MAGRGPAPKRTDRQMGHRTKAEQNVDAVEVEGVVDVPPAAPDWHASASAWYDSLPASGQAQFYEPSDWQTAYVAASVLSEALARGSDSLLREFRLLSAGLMVTEGDRRRGRLELTRKGATTTAPASDGTRARDRLRSVG